VDNFATDLLYSLSLAGRKQVRVVFSLLACLSASHLAASKTSKVSTFNSNRCLQVEVGLTGELFECILS